MLLLYRGSPTQSLHSFLIYIPLCFYFINMPDWHRTEYCKFTFHYASTLSKQKAQTYFEEHIFTFHYASTLSRSIDENDRCGCIYIPLCFYFIVIPPGSRDQTFSIYIPLCFYFITLQVRQSSNDTSFTFHYASTLSGRADRKKTRSNVIYIPLCFYFIVSVPCKQIWGYRIYIPLCFYFINVWCKKGGLHL